MLNFLFLLMLISIAELDWRTQMFSIKHVIPLITMISLAHPQNISLLVLYMCILIGNTLLAECIIGNGDIDLIWIGYCLVPAITWYEWLLLACFCQFILQYLSHHTSSTAPFVPALAFSWLITCTI